MESLLQSANWNGSREWHDQASTLGSIYESSWQTCYAAFFSFAHRAR
jgi:hypothetical protein